MRIRVGDGVRIRVRVRARVTDGLDARARGGVRVGLRGGVKAGPVAARARPLRRVRSGGASVGCCSPGEG